MKTKKIYIGIITLYGEEQNEERLHRFCSKLNLKPIGMGISKKYINKILSDLSEKGYEDYVIYECGEGKEKYFNLYYRSYKKVKI